MNRVAQTAILFVVTTRCFAQAPPSSALNGGEAATACRMLRGANIPASTIGLPTTGAQITHATTRRVGAAEYCRVLGAIRPVDPEARPIEFQINLPVVWNGKAVHFGGAVFDGWLGYSNGVRPSPMQIRGVPGPLERGYVTFGSDGGHHRRRFLIPGVVRLFDSKFAVNQEQRGNFEKDALKKTHDIAVEITRRRYGVNPSRMFFLGASTGGHEALEIVQRWPEDYNAVLSGYPVWTGAELGLQFLRVSQALYSKDGFLPRGTTKLLARSVTEACDTLDGTRDGLVSNVAACHFDPSTLLCSVRQQHGCLRPAQLATIQTFATEQHTTEPLWNGVDRMPGFNVLAGTDLTGTLGFLHHAERRPKLLLNSIQYVVAARAVRAFVAQDENFDPLLVDTRSTAPLVEQFRKGAKSYDTSETDLRAFAAHGGKLLLVHGTADAFIPTNSTVEYYERVRNAMGPAATDAFVRLSLIPGFAHGEGRFNAGFDAIGTLEQWLDEGQFVSPVVRDNNRKGHGRTRPMCLYPGWPQYTGAGDPNQSASYRCVSQQPVASGLLGNGSGASF